jgi:hypothetical protein
MYPIIDLLNNNKFVWGITMLLLNFGSRYVIADLGKFHEAVLSNEYFKKIVIFSMFFVATRDILTAFLLSVLYVIIIDGILNERRKYCIVPSKYKNISVSEKEYLDAKKIIEKYESVVVSEEETKQAYKEKYSNVYNIYENNIKNIKTKL